MDQSSIIEELLGVLNRLTEEKGVPQGKELFDKNVSQNGSSTADPNMKAPPTLRSNERRRLTEISTLFAKVFLEQQKKLAPDTKPDTLISKLSKDQAKMQKKVSERKESGGFGSVLALLVGGVALVAAAIPTIIASLFEKVGPLADSLKILGKAGLVGGLKLLMKGISKVFTIPLLKRIPIVGSLINFWFAYKEFKAGRYVPGIMELAAGIVNFVPGAGTALSIGIDILKTFMDSKGMFDEGGSLSNGNAWNTIKGWGANIGKWIWDNALWFPVLGGVKRFGMAYDAFSSGNNKEGFYQIATGILSFTGAAPLVKGFEILWGFLNNKEDQSKELSPDNSWSSRLKNWLKDKLKQLPYVIRKPLEWFGIIDESGESKISWDGVQDGAKKGFESVKSFIGSAWDKMKDPLKENIGVVTDFAKETWKKTKDFAQSAWDSVSEQAPKVWQSIKDSSASALEKVKGLGSVFSDSIEKMVGSASKIFKGLSNKIGSWVEDLFDGGDKPKSTPNKQDPRQEAFVNEQLSATISILKSSNMQTQWLNMLYDAAKEQVRLLGSLVNVSTQSYQELKRISGNSSSGGNVNVVVPSPSPKSPLVPFGDNRMAYANSPYSLGG